MHGEDREKLLASLSDWNNYNTGVCNIEDAIIKLAAEKRDFSWAISELTTALVKTAEERTRYMVKLESMGVKECDEALALAVKYL